MGSSGSAPPLSAGITLVELVIALALAALVTSFAVPSFGRLAANAQLTSASHQLIGALHFARSQSILRGIPTAVCVSENARECLARGRRARGWIIVALPDGHEDSSILLRTHTIADRIGLSATRERVTYWPASRAGSTSTFELCHRDIALAARAVIVSRTGRPRSAERSANSSLCAH